MNLASKQQIELGNCTNLEVLPGKGIQGKVGGKQVMAGSFNWMKKSGITIPEEMNEEVQVWEAEGKTIIHTAVDNFWIGMIGIEDTLRKESADVVQEFQKNGKQVCLLTGDRKAPAEYFAKKVGIEKVYSEVLPAEKARVIEKLQNEGNSVAMIGDGINDAPALAMADVGMALGSGTDVAMETSDVVILRNNLHSVFNAWKLSQEVIHKIKQNLFWAFAYNIIGIPIAMGILYPFSGYLLNPILAGMAMAFSSVSVVANTLLLRTLHIK
jgi:Cu+-exporting ATPase